MLSTKHRINILEIRFPIFPEFFLLNKLDEMRLIESNIEKIFQLCKKYKVKTLYAFGSILTSRFKETSDIDLLVDFKKSEIPFSDYADNFFGFMYSLEETLGRKIDLVCDDAVRNPYFRRELDATKYLIYG